MNRKKTLVILSALKNVMINYNDMYKCKNCKIESNVYKDFETDLDNSLVNLTCEGCYYDKDNR